MGISSRVLGCFTVIYGVFLVMETRDGNFITSFRVFYGDLRGISRDGNS